MIHDRTPECHQFPGHEYDHRPLTLQLTIASICKLRGSLMCLAFFFDILSMGGLFNQTLAGGRSTNAGIKCLYCMNWDLIISVH